MHLSIAILSSFSSTIDMSTLRRKWELLDFALRTNEFISHQSLIGFFFLYTFGIFQIQLDVFDCFLVNLLVLLHFLNYLYFGQWILVAVALVKYFLHNSRSVKALSGYILTFTHSNTDTKMFNLHQQQFGDQCLNQRPFYIQTRWDGGWNHHLSS